jgi:hypothetical protein
MDGFGFAQPYASFKVPVIDLARQHKAFKPQLVNHYTDIPTQPPKQTC